MYGLGLEKKGGGTLLRIATRLTVVDSTLDVGRLDVQGTIAAHYPVCVHFCWPVVGISLYYSEFHSGSMGCSCNPEPELGYFSRIDVKAPRVT